MDDRLLTVKQLATYLNVNDRTVLKLVSDGTVPGVKVVQILGRTLLLYQRSNKKPKFEKPEPDDTPAKPAKRKRTGKKAR